MIRVHTFGTVRDSHIQADVENYDGRRREGEVLESIDLHQSLRSTGDSFGVVTSIVYDVVISGQNTDLNLNVLYRPEVTQYRLTGKGVHGNTQKVWDNLTDAVRGIWKTDLKRREKMDREFQKSL